LSKAHILRTLEIPKKKEWRDGQKRDRKEEKSRGDTKRTDNTDQ